MEKKVTTATTTPTGVKKSTVVQICCYWLLHDKLFHSVLLLLLTFLLLFVCICYCISFACHSHVRNKLLCACACAPTADAAFT